uniref:NADP-dependent oxidoreductase domain-containing protein n=1 Tax=Plectus sambesii TaxID=2011161 RepID=A0A914UXL3_9BILA
MARRSGKVRYIGITGYPLQKLAAIVEKSSIKIDVVLSYCRGTLNDSALGEYIPIFQKHNVGIINAASLSMGLLTPQGPPAWHPAPDNIKNACKAAVDYCSSKNISIARLANNYSLNFPGVSTCLIGAHNAQVVRENLEASWTDLTELEVRVRERIMRRYFDPLNNANWEGVELQKYWKKLKALGLGALTTTP